MSAPRKLRCAIYTRKSTEEGLDQAFNSLHAQREACEAYVVSQAGLGWKALAKPYDDGGWSGGNMERPGLKALLADIAAGQIDVVVVYKVDRLTRSLTDFAKIVDAFDAHEVSFVSVTQAFNTTSSMGRLTLNVLLSFAQFEREVTGERIRDKIAASKAKGMWMGGVLPHGYDKPTDPVSRALVVNEAEAEEVRLIFATYLQHGSVNQLEAWLDEKQIRSKSWVTKAGRQMGGQRFSRGALFHLLKNRTYLGEVPHKDKSYPGVHPPIIDVATFDAVQDLMAQNTRVHRARPLRVKTAPLRGKLFDATGEPMTPTFTENRGGRQYRYYVSNSLMQGAGQAKSAAPIRRVPASAIEALVLERLQRLGRMEGADWGAAGAALRVEVQATTVELVAQASAWGVQADEGGLALLRRRLAVGEIVVAEREAGLVRLVVPVVMQVRGGRTWLQASGAGKKRQRDPTLVNGLRSAHDMVREAGLAPEALLAQLSRARAPENAYHRLLSRLAFLAPDIQLAIAEGRQPESLRLEHLVQGAIPVSWAEQRRVFGFA